MLILVVLLLSLLKVPIIIVLFMTSEEIHWLGNSLLDDRGYIWNTINEINIKNRENRVYKYIFDNLVKTTTTTTTTTKIETKNVLIDEKNYKDLVIYFSRYVHSKSMKILSLEYDELMGKNEELDLKTYLMADDYMLDNVLGKIKDIISILKFGDTKILIDTDNKLPGDITLKECCDVNYTSY